ncbi:MAG: hypothetical protein RBJ76_19660 [Stenomitos frigidus ULC029]
MTHFGWWTPYSPLPTPYSQQSKPKFSGMLRCNVPFREMGSTMKIWLVCFILLFGATEVLHWFKQISLPLPMLLLSGAFLAVASNYSKLTHLPFHLDYGKSDALQEDIPVAQLDVPQAPLQKPMRDSLSDRSGQPPISFTIRKPHQLEQ